MAEMTLIVSGMTCDHCVKAVTDAVSDVPGVESVAVDLDGGRVTVDGGDVDRTAVVEAISEAGYNTAS